MRLKKTFCLLFLAIPMVTWATFSCPLPIINDDTVTLTLSSTASSMDIESPFDACLTLTTPAHECPLNLQLNTSHVQGFVDLQSFEASSTITADQRVTTWRYKMTLDAIGPWVIHPFVFVLENERTKATREVLVKGVSLSPPTQLPATTGAPQLTAMPEPVAFGWMDAWLWIKDHTLFLIGLVLVATLAFTWKKWLKPTMRYFKERALPPEKRAILEFDRLQAQHLLEAGEVKRYFYELTGVVRRYFERAYTLRATRQTTEEFIQQLTHHLPFDVTTWESIQNFLQAADVVKFAGQKTPIDVAQQATTDARALVSYDANERQKLLKQRQPPRHS